MAAGAGEALSSFAMSSEGDASKALAGPRQSGEAAAGAAAPSKPAGAILRRRKLLIGAVAGAGLAVGGRHAWLRVARPGGPDGPLSEAARAHIAAAWRGLDPKRVLDCHVHVVGVGTGNSGCFVNPRMRSVLHPLEWARFDIYRRASGIDDMGRADQRYLERLVELATAQTPRGRLMLLPFERAYRPDGSPDDDATQLYIPNAHVLAATRRHPELFAAATSIHPYRSDALSALEDAVKQGARCVKWLPSAMRIDPSSKRCDAFYRKLVQLSMPLLSHAGDEAAMTVADAQRFGNPLLLRRALDAGVKVIVCHCASSGRGEDLDAPGRPKVDNFELFMRLLQDRRYADRLYGDISALAQFNRCQYLDGLLARRELHSRLINGSDYPLVAINALARTGKLESVGLITAAERATLNEIDRHNPLLFDFVLKRTLKSKEGARFSDEVFMPRVGLFSPV